MRRKVHGTAGRNNALMAQASRETRKAGGEPTKNTTIAVVATNVRLTQAQERKTIGEVSCYRHRYAAGSFKK